MTPQLQQAIKLLQLNRLELVGLVQQELEENPVLEEQVRREVDEDEVESLRDARTNRGRIRKRSPLRARDGAGDRRRWSAADADADFELKRSRTPRRLPTSSGRITSTRIRRPSCRSPGRGGRRAPSLDATLTRRVTLSEHLEWQLQLTDFPFEEEVAARFIIGNLDDRGYLQADVSELARQSGVSEETRRIRAGARCRNSIRPAWRLAICASACCPGFGVLEGHRRRAGVAHSRRVSRSLAEARLPRVARAALGVRGSPRSIAASRQRHRRVSSRGPGRAFGGEDPVYITPDIYVYKVNDDFHILLNDDGLPRLRINGLYRDVLTRGNSVGPRTPRSYVQEKVRSALWLIKSIHQRQRTIYRVMQSIIKYQREFFERGINHLKPLNLRDVADDIEMHESTVSRVTSNEVRQHSPGDLRVEVLLQFEHQPFRGRRDRQRECEGEDPQAHHQRGFRAGRCPTSGSPRCSRSPISISPAGRSRSTERR